MQKKWTEERLIEMRDVLLPKSKTLGDALRAAEKSWKIKLHVRTLQRNFRARFGRSAADFLKQEPAHLVATAQPGDAEQIQHLIAAVKGRPKSLEQLCDSLRMYPSQLRKLVTRAVDEGYSVRVLGDELHFTGLQPRSEPQTIKFKKPQKSLIFGVMSDTHLGSKYCRIDELCDFVEIAYEAGVRDIFHAGDVLEGHKMYRGWELEVSHVGFTAQAETFIETVPHKPGLTYHFITGNHDLSFHKLSGQEPGEALVAMAREQGRDDLKYLGPERALVYYGGASESEGLLIELYHPGGGGGYASSYKLQRLIASMQPGTKPQLLFQGHEHQYVHIFERHVHAIKPGCFQSQTPYMLRKNLQPSLGGLIVRADVTENFSIRRVSTEFVPYYGAYDRKRA
jgi:predicted phosphodiesterase